MNRLFHEKPILILSAIAGFFLLVSLGIFILSVVPISSRLILHFDALYGVRLFGTVSDVLWFWVFGLFMCGLNLFLAHVFYRRERIIAYLFIGTNIILSLLLLILMAVIASVN